MKTRSRKAKYFYVSSSSRWFVVKAYRKSTALRVAKEELYTPFFTVREATSEEIGYYERVHLQGSLPVEEET
jgi:hypothetical protein